ncbi:radical SAM protein [Candidatus Bathyarchaeota archaeon A05DMB-2]|jgi:radical SAM protein with 4Fe4S-binding SPASM domain|nr:radical SAM protein [Candidatus Bathyarchaeota archaeon A05DMB-2]
MVKGKAPLHMITWRCTRRCVGSCLYCSYTPEYAVDAEVDTRTAYKIVDETYYFGVPWFGISGGEPLLRKDIFDIAEYARKMGLEVSLITSGFVFDEKRLSNLVRNEIHTAVSIDGTRESNDQIRGKGSYDKALFALEKLSENGILDCIVTTMTKHNIKDAEHIVKLAAEHGARMVVFHNLVPVGRAGPNMPDLAPSPEEYEAAFNNIYDLYIKYAGKIDVNVYAPFYARIFKQRNPAAFDDWYTKRFLGKCTFGGRYISLTENGDYRSCGFNEHYRLGNVKYKGLTETWDELQHSTLHLKLRDKSNLKGKCGVCEYREICGGCRTRAEYYTGDLFESDPACAYVPKVLREQKAASAPLFCS